MVEMTLTQLQNEGYSFTYSNNKTKILIVRKKQRVFICHWYTDPTILTDPIFIGNYKKYKNIKNTGKNNV